MSRSYKQNDIHSRKLTHSKGNHRGKRNKPRTNKGSNSYNNSADIAGTNYHKPFQH